MYPPTLQPFSAGYDQATLRVAPTDSKSAHINRAFCADLRYWSDETASRCTGPLYIQQPSVPGHIPVYPDDDTEFGVIKLPPNVVNKLDIARLPGVETFLMANQSHESQLKQFYQ